VLACAASAQAITLSVFTNPHPLLGGGTIGFAYIGDGFVGSVQNDGIGSVLYRTDTTGGNVQLFAPTINIHGPNSASEHFVSSSLGLGGFPSRDVYVAAGNGILHITHDGSTGNEFITSVNGTATNQLASGVRGIMFDSIGTFGNDMLVTTIGGQVYRVDSAGHATLLASTGEDTEGLDIAPLGTFGSFAGQLFVASENSGAIRAIDTLGNISVITHVASAEELTFVPLNLGASGNPVEGFYGSDYTPDVLKAPATDFSGMLGDIVVTGETTHVVNLVHWDTGSSSAIVSQIGTFPNQPEDGIFVTAAIVNPCPPTNPNCVATVPEPDSLWLMILGALAALAMPGWRTLRRTTHMA
jgi:hypothetical protein